MTEKKARYRQRLGHWGERVAESYLNARGYQVIDRNVRTPYGEIDLIAMKGELVVFIEVKTRSSSKYGLPEASVTSQKQTHLVAAIEAYFQSHPEHAGDCRLDVIAIQGSPNQPNPQIVHFENALS